MLIGIVGKPNVGKSTFFKACTLANTEIANYPFVTIKPNRGVGYVRVECADKFFNTKCKPREGFCIEHNRFVPVELLDVAGLVPGAHEGKGMGNQFLDDLRQADVLVHVIDVSGSTNENGEPVEPLSYNPENDVLFLENELDMWFFQIFMKVWNKFSKQVALEHADPVKAIVKQFSGLNATDDIVKECFRELGLSNEITKWSEPELKKFASLLRKKTKPIIIAANKIDYPGAEKNLESLKERFRETTIIATSSESELALREASLKGMIKYIPGDSSFEIKDESALSEKQKAALSFVKEKILGRLKSTGVQDVLNEAVFSVLKCIYVFPGGVSKLADQFGNVLPDCFILPEGSTALDFAYKVHSDLGDNFIKATDVKRKQTIGKEHVLKSGDVIEIHARG